MPGWCVVKSCSNSARKSGCSELSWHSFPSHDKSLMAEWLARVGKVEEQVNKHWTICSEHFEPKLIEKTLAGRKRLKRGAVPTIFDQEDIKRRRLSIQQTREKLLAAEVAFMNGESIPNELIQDLSNDQNNDSAEVEKLNGIRKVLKELKQAKKTRETTESQSDVRVNDTITITMLAEDDGNSQRVSSIVTEKEQYEMTIYNLKLEQERLQNELYKERQTRIDLEQQKDKLVQHNTELQKFLENEQSLRKTSDVELSKEIKKRTKIEQELESVSFNFKYLSKNPKSMQYYCGFNAEEFEAFMDFLGHNACEYVNFHDPSKTLNHDGRKYVPGPQRNMSAKDQLLMSLCRVRVGLTTKDLAIRFQVSPGQVCKVTNAFVALMQNRLQEEKLWPDTKNIHIHNHQWPEILKPFHQRVRMLIESLKSHGEKAKLHQKLSMVAS